MTVAIPFTFVGGTVISSSQVNANFAALANAVNVGTRTILTADMVFPVSPGMSPFGATSTPVTDVLNVLQSTYDLNGHTAQIVASAGTYTETVFLRGPVLGQHTPGNILISGNTGAPTTVLFSGTPGFLLNNGASMQIQGVQIANGSSDAIAVGDFSTAWFQFVDFGACPGGSHVHTVRRAFGFCIGNYSISGGAVAHYDLDAADLHIQQATPPTTPPTPGLPTVNLTNTPNFTAAFARVADVALLKVLATFTGTGATGVRFIGTTNSVIATGNLGGGPTTYLPGNSPGTLATGAVYV
jgi:hypothetical protein